MLENALNLGHLLMTPIVIRTQQYPISSASTSHGSIGALQPVNAIQCHIYQQFSGPNRIIIFNVNAFRTTHYGSSSRHRWIIEPEN